MASLVPSKESLTLNCEVCTCWSSHCTSLDARGLSQSSGEKRTRAESINPLPPNSGNQGKATFVSTLQASCRRRRMWVRNLWQIRITDTFFFSITYNDPNLCFHVSLLFNLILSWLFYTILMSSSLSLVQEEIIVWATVRKSPDVLLHFQFPLTWRPWNFLRGGFKSYLRKR